MMSSYPENILIDSSTKESNRKLYNYSEKSESAKFYFNQFSKNENVESNLQPDYSKVPAEMKELMAFLKENAPKDGVIVELGGSKYQHRSGYPNYTFPNYIPLDISYTSIQGYVDAYDRFGIVADACQLPFKDRSVDVIFTHTFLEHPLKPENVLKEIDRVLKPGGLVVHSDAWNCRWWQRYGVVGIKKFGEMTGKEKMIFIGAKITEFKLFRMPAIIGQRAISLLFRKKKEKMDLRYKKLDPNYELHLYCDEDAASSIDPIDVMLFYESRNYRALPQLSFFNKLFFRNLNIYFRKAI